MLRTFTHEDAWHLGSLLAELARMRHAPVVVDIRRGAQQLFRCALPEAVDDYLRSLLNRVDTAEMRGDTDRMDRLTRHAAEVAAHHAVAPDNAIEAVTMRGGFLHRRRGRPRSAVELLTARLPALLPGCPAERSPRQSLRVPSVARARCAASPDPRRTGRARGRPCS